MVHCLLKDRKEFIDYDSKEIFMNKVNVHREQDGKICYVEINHPEKRNILSIDIMKRLISIFQSFYQDPEIRVVILSGQGLHFCAGGDLRWMKLDQESSDIENLNDVSLLFKLFYTIYQCPVPVITSVQGSVYGGGIGLVATSDIVVAEEQAQFCFSELKIGLVPSVISPFVLKKMAYSKAQIYMLSAKIFSAQEALQSGLIHFVGDEKTNKDHLNDLIASFLTFDKKALTKAKELLHFVPERPIEDVKGYCIKVLAERRKSPEVIQKINRFLNKK